MRKKERLIVLFDGTWNDPEDLTNVYQLSTLIEEDDGEVHQRFFYEPGVGTATGDKLRGGLFGYGLSKNLLQGYDWLVKHYQAGDEIWVFGFSRGAYTARSMVGLIRKCGLLKTSTPTLLQRAETLYRDKSASPDSAPCMAFRQHYSHDVRIHFLGVWDTVGALGIPGTMISEHGFYAWHDTELSKIVSYAYHAMAIDEHREAYEVAMWTNEDGKQKAENVAVEQRWFIGAHANVGGGYGKDPLAGIALAWMLAKAQAAQLKLKPYTVADRAYLTAPTDSFKAFAYGLYGWFKGIFNPGDGRFYRPYSVKQGARKAVNVSVDSSVIAKWQAQSDYRPPTLIKAGIDPSNMTNPP
ncbi:DUF2235 domain-containing protein [Methylophilus medardicus]|uniref:DUF2235 domain-containing protein n=1 Tax=Methylophilus medardicus TaxID=2588534 RepID=A0A5B8CUP5_9PROT|nr:DUF2235 domain-containing protein [Methylophilus medardicus]QDC44625.1 DUF2235 domain-containing protein [Methylophilus medardicus]QDC49632.1 DUF2235 domain-containing protein [Methylophilus medardicus]QDC53337.1 DUF2235 domain-containing protein [Methylophilus medardicus]